MSLHEMPDACCFKSPQLLWENGDSDPHFTGREPEPRDHYAQPHG